MDKTGAMALRLSAADRETFLDRYQTTLAEQHGRTMKEFVVVPAELVGRADELEDWFDRSWDWIGTLEPKPTKRR